MTVAPVILTGAPLDFADLARIAGGAVPVTAAEDALERVRRGRSALEAAITAGVPVYGTTTGVGAMKDWVPDPDRAAGFNAGLVRAHAFSVGAPLPVAVVRMAMAVRVNVVLAGHTGATADFVRTYLGWLDHRLTPVVRSIGSLGCGDIGMMGQIGAAIGGDGEAYFRGERLPARTAIAAAGLAPFAFGPKDGLTALSSNASSVALAAAMLRRAAGTVRTMMATGLTSAAAMAALPGPSESAARLGTPRQAEVGRWIAAQLRRSAAPATDTRVHDPLGLRMMPQVFAAALDALRDAGEIVRTDTALNDDNPVLLDDRLLSSGGSLPIDLVLAVEKAAIAIAHAARSTMNRCVLLANGRIAGLPVNLVAPGSAMTGFGPALKLAGELFVRIRRSASPVSLEPVVVADGIEDEATFLPLAIDGMNRQLDAFDLLLALEALFAAAAFDLVDHRPEGLAGEIHRLVRAHAAPHDRDRPLASEIEAIAAALASAEGRARSIECAPLAGFDEFFALARETNIPLASST